MGMTEPPAPPEYTRYRSRPRLFGRRGGGDTALDELRAEREDEPPRRSWRAPSAGRVVAWLAAALVAWIVLSALLFVISAQLHSRDVSRAGLAGGGLGVFEPQTTLVLGSDVRSADTAEPGAQTSGNGRSDSIVLLRSGGGHSAKLAIPRDTVVDIPGHGRDKINAAFALGGPQLAAQTVSQFLGIAIDHVFLTSFDSLPQLVDAMGGIDYTGGCVVSKINGGFRNGGYTLRLRGGTTHIDGRQALALARTRENACNPRENDLTRARRQQKVIAAMRSRVFSLGGFVRLPRIAWEAPKALRTDMSGPSLLGYAFGLGIAGSPPARVLRPSGGVTLPDGGAGLVVSDAERKAAAARFLRG